MAKRFLLFFFPLALIVNAASVLIFLKQRQLDHELLERREKTNLRLVKDNIRDFYEPLVYNVKYLSQRQLIRDFLTGRMENKQEIEKELVNILKIAGDYDQLRLLDPHGNEVVRVNKKQGVVYTQDDSLLQDKSQRSYVKRILQLKPGQIFIGAIDLNQEFGKIEVPHKPVVRVGMRIADDQGEIIGMVITNYWMTNYLKKLAANLGEDSDLMLLNSTGNFIFAPEPYPKFTHITDTTNTGLRDFFADEWAQMDANETGSLMTDNGLFVYSRITSEIDDRDEEDRMIVLSHVNPKTLAANATFPLWMFLVILLVANMLVGWVSWVLGRNQQELEEANLKLEDRVEQRTKELNELQLRFKGIFDNTFQFIGLLETNGTLLEANQTALDFGGFTMEQARGLKFYDAPWWSLSEETKTQLKEAIIRASKGDFVRYDVEVLGGDGNTIIIDFSLRPIVENEKVIYLVAEGRDISDKIVLEANLKESERNFRTIFETVDSGLVYQNAEGLITSANSAAERILGLTLEEMTGRKSVDPRWKAIHEDGSDFPGETHPPMIALQTGKEIKDRVMGVYHPDKEQHVWIRVSAYPVFEEGSEKPTKVYSTFEDITEEYLAKVALSNSEKRFKLAAKGTKAGIWEWIDVSKSDEWWSPQFYHLLGYEDQEIPATLENFGKFLHSDDEEKTFALVKKHFAKEADFGLEYRLKTKSGEYRWFLGSGQAEWDAEGNPLTMVGTIVDIHDKKMLEVEMENKVAERTEQLALINKELESFSYSVSHDLRAPLRAVNGFAEILQEDYYDKLDDEGKDTIKVIRDNARYMGQLIDDLLQFSRLGRQEMKQVGIDMNGLINEVLEGQKQTMDLTDYTIDIQTLPEAKGDRDLIKQVVVNLVSNALKYSSKNEHPKVIIGSEDVEGKTTYFVKDNGVGFNMEYADKLFGVFQRLHSQQEFEGTGVGLAIAERIVKRHKGKIWAKAKFNKGACFYFQI